jgi:CRP-like cAMP-binding protein
MMTELMPQLGLDPSVLTFGSLSSRLSDIVAANVTVANAVALIGAIFYVIRYSMRTIVPLRFFGIMGDLAFVLYGALSHSFATFFLYLLLLPVNSIRLYQMIKLVKRARLSAEGDLSMKWLEPYMTHRHYRKNSVVFRQGRKANEMFIVVTGKFYIKSLDIELKPGSVFGEIGFLAPRNRRTQTVECVESGKVLTITYDKLLELFFTNPEFGYYFLRLSSERLLANLARLEKIIEQNKEVIRQMGAQEGSRPSP